MRAIPGAVWWKHLSLVTGGAVLCAFGLGLGAHAFALVAPPPGDGAASGGMPSRAPGVASQEGEPGGRRVSAPKVASYTLKASLDPEAHLVEGAGVLTWKNTSHAPVTELWFHLYLNAFSDDRTLFLRGLLSRGEDKKGGISIKSLRVKEHGTQDLWGVAARHSPGDENDATDIRVPLGQPVMPGQTVHVEMEWESTLPPVIARTGHGDGFHMVAQWFPKIAVLNKDGTWAHFAFHRNAEFFADYGDYDVTLNVPSGWTVGATGERVSSTPEGERTLDRYVAQDVHDFAWAAWDRFEERNLKIDGVDVRLLYPPGHDQNANRTEEALTVSFPLFREQLGAYPYPNLTVVHPPQGARRAGGMEYPTLITTGGPWYAGYLHRSVELVTIHELGHQWFYGLIGSNEARWPFLDEGLNTYVEMVAMEAGYGTGSALDLPWLQISVEALHRAGAAMAGHTEPVAQPASDFWGRSALGGLVYSRTGTAMRTLANVYGEDAVEKALREYSLVHRYRHPGPEALLTTLKRGLGPQAVENLTKALFKRGWVDYQVTYIESHLRPEPEPDPEPELDPEGDVEGDVEGEPGGNVASEPEPEGHVASEDRAGPGRAFPAEQAPEESPTGAEQKPEALKDTEPPAALPPEGPPYVGRAVIHRLGTLEFPVEVEFIAEDGTKTRKTWSGDSAWVSLPYQGESPLSAVVVDPDRRITLDQDLINNARSVSPRLNFGVFSRLVYWSELWLGGLGQ